MIVLPRSRNIVNRRHNQNHGARRILKILLSHFKENYFGKKRFTASKEITIHEKKKQTISHFTGKKFGHSRITKKPFTTLLLRRQLIDILKTDILHAFSLDYEKPSQFHSGEFVEPRDFFP